MEANKMKSFVDAVSGMRIKMSELPKVSLSGLDRESELTIGRWYLHFIGKSEVKKITERDIRRGIELLLGVVGLFEMVDSCTVDRVLEPIDNLSLLIRSEIDLMLVDLSFYNRAMSTSRVIVVKGDKTREITFKDQSNIFTRKITYDMRYYPTKEDKYLTVFRKATRSKEEEEPHQEEPVVQTRAEKLEEAIDTLRQVRSFYVSDENTIEEHKKEM